MVMNFEDPPYVNIVIDWGDPCNIVINREDPRPPITYYVIYGQPLMAFIITNYGDPKSIYLGFGQYENWKQFFWTLSCAFLKGAILLAEITTMASC